MRRHPRLAAAFATMLSFAAPAVTQAWPVNADEGVAVVSKPGHQFIWSLVADGSGGVIVVWSDSTAATHRDIRATHVLANGWLDATWHPLGAPVCTAPDEQTAAAAVSDGAGGVIVQWSDRRNGTDFDVYAHHLLASGNLDPAWPVDGGAVCVATGQQFSGGANGSHSQLIPDGNGGALTTWQDGRTADVDVFAHHILATGVDPAWPVNGLPVSTAAGGVQAPGLASDGAGGAIVSWFDFRAGLGNPDIYAHHVLADGTLHGSWPSGGLAVCTAADQQRYVEGVSDGSGGAILVWHDRRSGTNFDIYAHHVSGAGVLDGSVPANGVAVCTAVGDQARVRVIPDATGGALTLWSDSRDGVNKAVYVHRLLATSVPDPGWPANGRAVRIETGEPAASGAVYQRGFVSDGAGGALVAWTDFRNGLADVYAHHVLANGDLDAVWPADGRGVSVAGGAQTAPAMIPDGDGHFIVGWFDERSSTGADPWLQRVTLQGVIGGIEWTISSSTLPNLQRGSMDWGDYDNDGDLDLLMTGTDGSGPRCYLYANDGNGGFTDVNAGLPGIEWSSAEWGDFDGDGDLDIAMAGWNGTPAISRIYQNQSGTFALLYELPGVWGAAVAWGDHDNDGDLDLLLAGRGNDNTPIAILYSNENGTWANTNAGFTGVTACDADWGDYDGDGRMDLLLAGATASGEPLTRLYRNLGFQYGVVDVGLPNVSAMDGSLGWGDYDADGDLDVLITGWDNAVRHCAVFRNEGNGTFVDIDANLPGISSGAAAWGDYDNDGDLDILTAGYSDQNAGLSNLYRNDDGTFVNANAGFSQLFYSAVAWADVDGDGDLDASISGTPDHFNAQASVFLSDGATPNDPPSVPYGLVAIRNGSLVEFSWSNSTDPQTPVFGLSYNVRASYTSGGEFPQPSLSAPNGWRRVVRWGNAGPGMSHWSHLANGPIYCSVQAIDGAFAGSEFGNEELVLAVDGPTTGVSDLHGAAPNPFRATTEILFAQARAGHVEIAIHDLAGRRVRLLEHGERPAGQGRSAWDGRGDAGERLPAGLYFVRVELAGERFTGKVVLAD